MIGHTLGAYRIMREVGETGLGTLYVGQHETGLAVSVRALPRDHGDIASLMRWQQIATAAAQTGHPGVQGIYEYLRDTRGNAYLVTELVPGESVGVALARDHHFYPDIVAKLAWQIAAAVGTAHEAGILHGLIRPDSIFVMPDPSAGYRVKVCDFGLTAFVPEQKPAWNEARVLQVLGMPFYMAPETCESGRRDHRADIYSLGCMMFHMACGRPPFLAQSAFDLANAHIHSPPKRVTEFEPSVPPALDAIIGQATMKEPGARQASMREIAVALERLVTHGTVTDPGQVRTVMLDVNVAAGRPPRRRSWAVHFAAAAIVALGAVGGTALLLSRRGRGAPVVVPPAEKPVAPPPPNVVVPPPSNVQKDLIAAVDALAAEKWDDAEAAAKRALALSPGEPQAEKLLRWAKLGPKHRAAYKDFRRAVDDGDRAAAKRRFGRIPEDGPYHERAQRELDAMKK